MNKLMAMQELVNAMKRSVAEGCTDHLDSCDDQGAFWYKAIEGAEEVLSNKHSEDQKLYVWGPISTTSINAEGNVVHTEEYPPKTSGGSEKDS